MLRLLLLWLTASLKHNLSAKNLSLSLSLSHTHVLNCTAIYTLTMQCTPAEQPYDYLPPTSMDVHTMVGEKKPLIKAGQGLYQEYILQLHNTIPTHVHALQAVQHLVSMTLTPTQSMHSVWKHGQGLHPAPTYIHVHTCTCTPLPPFPTIECALH